MYCVITFNHKNYGLRVLTGSSALIFLNQKDVVLVKKKKSQQVATGFLTGSPGHTGFFFPLFFLQPDSISVPDRSGSRSTRRAGLSFETITKTIVVFVNMLKTERRQNLLTWWAAFHHQMF